MKCHSTLVLLACTAAAATAHARRVVAPPTPLAFDELFIPPPAPLAPSEKLKRLDGKRVRMVGFMADLEIPARGGFYLTPFPVQCDEQGGGTGDLPPSSVFVVVRSAAGEELAHRRGALEVIGVLEVGPREDQDGRVTTIRIVLDRPGAQHSRKEHSR